MCKALSIKTAEYERGDGFIKSFDFINGAAVNFEPAFSFMGDDEDYEAVIGKLTELCPEAIPDYIRLIFIDTVVANPDRHTNNFGVLRDTASGKILGLAPNFDNNMALISRGYPSSPKKPDLLIRLFNDVLTAHSEYKAYLPVIEEETVRKCVEEMHMRVKKEQIVNLIMSRYNLIIK